MSYIVNLKNAESIRNKTQQLNENSTNIEYPSAQAVYDTIQDNRVGVKTIDGGEIFNNYENNKAIAPFSSARGDGTTAGGKCFSIQNIVDLSKSTSVVRCTMGLDSVDGLEVGDIVSATIGINYTNFANIVNIISEANEIELDAYPIGCTLSTVTNGSAVIWVGAKPLIGTQVLGFGQSTDGIRNIAIHEGAHSCGEENISAGKYAFTSGKKNVAGYAAHAQNRENKALANLSSAGGWLNEAHGQASDVGGQNSKAIGDQTFSRGNYNTAGSKAFTVKSMSFEQVPETPEEEITGNIVTAYVSSSGSETSYGGNIDNPASNIGYAIDECISVGALVSKDDVLVINLLDDVNWIKPSTEHIFKIIVQSIDDQQKKLTITENSEFKGNMEFKNINVIGGNKSLRFSGHDITFDKGSTLGVWYVDYGYPILDRECDGQTIIFNGKGNSFSLCLGNSYGRLTYTKDITTIADDNSRCIFYFGSSYGKPVYKKNLNFDFRSASEISFSNLWSAESYALEGAIQIINSSAIPLTTETNGLNSIAYDKKWILTNNSACKDALLFTEETGKFKVKDGYTVIAYNIFDEAFESTNGLLDLSSASGEYNIDVIESSTYEGTIVLDSVVGLEINDIVSIKKVSSQDFILNMASITNINTETSTLTVQGYPSQANRFLNTNTQLFVLDKPLVGTTNIGTASITIGLFNKTIGRAAVTNGEGLIAMGDHQAVYGYYNKNKPDTVLEVGCGVDDSNRSNAFEVYKDGSVRLYDIKISRERWRRLLEKSIEEVDLSDYYTKEEVDNLIPDIVVSSTVPLNPSEGTIWIMPI